MTNKVMITTMKTQISQACTWLDQQLPLLYNQHIADKLDMTTLDKIILQCMDKPILMAALMVYANTLKQRTTTTNQPGDKKQFAKPPHQIKQCLVNITFDEKEFLVLQNANALVKLAPPTNTTTSTLTQSQNASTSTVTMVSSAPPVNTHQPYNYKKELD